MTRIGQLQTLDSAPGEKLHRGKRRKEKPADETHKKASSRISPEEHAQRHFPDAPEIQAIDIKLLKGEEPLTPQERRAIRAYINKHLVFSPNIESSLTEEFL